MNQNKIYVEGFDDIQKLLLICVLKQYLKNKKINTVIFGDKLSKKILQQRIIKKFLKKNNVVNFGNFKNKFKTIFFLLFSIDKIIKVWFHNCATGHTQHTLSTPQVSK